MEITATALIGNPWFEITKDILQGFLDSIRADIFISHVWNSTKGINTMKKLFKHNMRLHILPLLLVDCIYYLFDMQFHTILRYINYPIMLFSIFIHTIIYIEFANAFNSVNGIKKIKSTKQEGTFVDTITITIMMAIYQLVVYFSTAVVNFIFEDKFYLFGLFLTFGILTIYHSLYSYNNLWQKIDLDISRRVNVHEIRWAYFLGYGLIATIVYIYTTNAYILAIYNMYMAMLLSIPLLQPFDFNFYFVDKPIYFKINLTVFSYIIGWIFRISKKIIEIST